MAIIRPKSLCAKRGSENTLNMVVNTHDQLSSYSADKEDISKSITSHAFLISVNNSHIWSKKQKPLEL